MILGRFKCFNSIEFIYDLRWVLLLHSFLFLGFAESQRYLRLEGSFNARSESDFTSSSNVSFVLPRGTQGEILERQKFLSGNFGIKIRIHEGSRAGTETWVYYNSREPESTPMSFFSSKPSSVLREPSNLSRAHSLLTQSTTQALARAPRGAPRDPLSPEPLAEGGVSLFCSNCTTSSSLSAAGQLNQQIRPILGSLSPSGPNPSGFIHPLPGSRQTSGFGTRYATLGGVRVREHHAGVDFQSAFRSPVKAAKSGVILRAVNHCGPRSTGCGGGYGNHVILDHQDGTFSLYAHMDRECSALRGSGQSLSQGDVLGCVGNSGSVRGRTGVHLHFEIRKGRRPGREGVSSFFEATPMDPRRFIGLG